jgi:hypothetical protein
MMFYKEDWEKSKQRFKALWNREIIDRCCISVTAPSKGSSYSEAKVPERYADKVKYWMDYSLYHLDGVEQIRHLDLLLSLDKLDMIQWTSVVGQPPAVDYIPVLKKIQEAGKCLLLNVKAKYVEELLTELSSKGLYIVTEAESEDDARDLVKLAEKLTTK